MSRQRSKFNLTRRISYGIALAVMLSSTAVAEDSDTMLWQAIASGQAVALLRHATAPGFGDPDDFTLGDCSTQRNLSKAGRVEARRIGDRFRSHGIKHAFVRASQWCRALDTARLLDLGPVTSTPALNSFFEDRDSRTAQTQAVKQLILDQSIKRPRVFVTHQVNIMALTGQSAASGELVIVRPVAGALQTLGRIPAPE